jgi:hypothetical protein
LSNDLRSTVELRPRQALGNSCRIDVVVDERMGGAAGLPVRSLLQPRRERGFGHDGWITSKYLGLQIPLAVWHRA